MRCGSATSSPAISSQGPRRGRAAGDQPEHRAEGLQGAGDQGARGRTARPGDLHHRGDPQPGRAARADRASPFPARWLAAADAAGWTRTGSWRSSPACCGIFVSVAAALPTGAARRDARRRAWHERHREPAAWASPTARPGAARLHAGDPRRARGRAGRPERRRQDHPAEPGGRPGGADRRAR